MKVEYEMQYGHSFCRKHLELILVYSLNLNMFLVLLVVSRSWLSAGLKSEDVVTNANRNYIRIEGDIMFGGLFSLHSHKEDQKSKNPCGPIKDDVGMQRLEAMLFATKRINAEKTILPAVFRLGAHIRDTCSSDTYALEQSVDFIRGHIRSLDVSDQACYDGGFPSTRTPINPVVGVIGAAASKESTMVANILRLFKVST